MAFDSVTDEEKQLTFHLLTFQIQEKMRSSSLCCWQWMMKTGHLPHLVDVCARLIHSCTKINWVQVEQASQAFKGEDLKIFHSWLSFRRLGEQNLMSVHLMFEKSDWPPSQMHQNMFQSEKISALDPQDNLLILGGIGRHFESALTRVLRWISLTGNECSLYLLKPPHELQRPFPQRLP